MPVILPNNLTGLQQNDHILGIRRDWNANFSRVIHTIKPGPGIRVYLNNGVAVISADPSNGNNGFQVLADEIHLTSDGVTVSHLPASTVGTTAYQVYGTAVVTGTWLNFVTNVIIFNNAGHAYSFGTSGTVGTALMQYPMGTVRAVEKTVWTGTAFYDIYRIVTYLGSASGTSYSLVFTGTSC